MAKPLILYDSLAHPPKNQLIADPTVSATWPLANFGIANAVDYKSYTLWKTADATTLQVIDIDLGAGVTRDADYIAFVNHNLFTATAEVQILADSFTPPTTVRKAYFQITEDGVSYETFTAPGALRYWRVEIKHLSYPFDATPYFAEMFLGLKTSLPEFLTPQFDPFLTGVEIAGSRSVGGHYLAGTTRGETHRGTIEFGRAGAARADFTSDLNAFIDDHALKRQPFIFVVDSDDSDFDTGRYVKMTDTGLAPRTGVGGTWQRLMFKIPIEEAWMEAVT